MTLEAAVGEITYHSTGGTKDPPAGSLLEECTAMEHLAALRDLAEQRGLKPLHETLRQRYPHDAS
jgi:hypothetical protein